MPTSDLSKTLKKQLMKSRIKSLLLILTFFTPALFFLALGFQAWSQLSHKWVILFCLSSFTILTGFLYKYISRKNVIVTSYAEDEFLPQNRESWGSQEKEIWEDAIEEVKKLVAEAPDINDVFQKHPLALAEFIAAKYNDRHKFDITPIEGLILVEEVSRRFRNVVQNHIPLVEQITLKRALMAYSITQNRYVSMLRKYVPLAWTASEFYRNPAGKISESVTGVKKEVFDDLTLAAQQKFKTWFLFQCSEVLMDLYSGRLSVARTDLSTSEAYNNDQFHLDQGTEPIRMVLVGQISSGKSTFVNRLKQETVAEVGMLRTTRSKTIYQTALNDEVSLHICDLPGLDNKSNSLESILSEIVSADLVVWLVKASQPAKKLDQELRQHFDNYFREATNITQKKPKILGVLTHIDQLHSVGLKDKGEIPQIISEAIQYNQEIINPDAILPLNNQTDDGLEEIKSKIEEFLGDALQVQLNRRRVASNKRGVGVQLKRLGTGFTGAVNIFKV